MENEILGLRNLGPKNILISESFKSLRTNLIYSENVKVITVTSSLPSEGKTFNAFNLALSFAMMDKRVLLIDCDLRKGSLKRYFTFKHSLNGLSEALTGQSGEILHETAYPNLSVILSGKVPPNPSELLSSTMFESILSQLKSSFDYIIIDTPPMSVSMDATITGRLSDGVVLVVRNDYVKKKIVKRTTTQLYRNGSRVLGAVLNRVKRDQVDYESYGYEYYGEEKAK